MMVITAEGGTERRGGGASFMALGANAERADGRGRSADEREGIPFGRLRHRRRRRGLICEMMCDTDKARSRRRRDSCDSGRAGRWRTGGWPRPREAGPVTETGEMLSDTPRRYSFRLWGRRRCRRRRRRQGEPSQRPCPAHQAHAARGGETGMTRGREGRGGRTDKHAGREGGMKGGAPRALHSSSVASRFRSFSISGSVSGSCRDCSTCIQQRRWQNFRRTSIVFYKHDAAI